MWKNKPEVKIIADSVNNAGNRLITFELHYWRSILAEVNTHRQLSRNAASSRAQNFKSRCNDVWENPHVPNHWNAEKPGMVGGEEFSPEVKDYINDRIKDLARYTVQYLNSLDQEVMKNTGHYIHKQYLNRYLEPFTTVTQLITGTEWDNFFKLRMAQDAQPEMQDLAHEMFSQMNNHEPSKTMMHLPYIHAEDLQKYDMELLVKISVARCARVSYKAYTGQDDLEKDLRLYKRLYDRGHRSPFEHVAIAVSGQQFYNLNGWRSLRYDIEHSHSGSAGSLQEISGISNL